MTMHTNNNFVVLGGGIDTFSVLNGLKKYTDKITAIVTMADSGGSAKMERDEFGLLPSSDIRKSLIALADVSGQDSILLRNLFQYRYSQGSGIEGMTFGNLFLVALTKLLGSQEAAIEKAGELLKIKGRVLPVSLTKVDLVAHYADGTTVVGEHAIDEPTHNGEIAIKKLTTRPKAQITESAHDAIRNADVIIIGPGGFYTTIVATLIVEGVKKAVVRSHAKKIFILNLMTEWGQTYGFSASKYLTVLDNYLPVSNLDYVLINNALLPPDVLKRYYAYHANVVVNDLDTHKHFKVIATDLISKTRISAQKGDRLKRSLIRHSPQKLTSAILSIV